MYFMESYKHYLLGCYFRVESDHKPIIGSLVLKSQNIELQNVMRYSLSLNLKLSTVQPYGMVMWMFCLKVLILEDIHAQWQKSMNFHANHEKYA